MPRIAEHRRSTRRSWGRGGRNASALPPAIAGAISAATDPANRPRVSPNLTLANTPTKSGHQFAAGELPCAAKGRSVKIEFFPGSLAQDSRGFSENRFYRSRFEILNIVKSVINRIKIRKIQTQLFCDPHD